LATRNIKTPSSDSTSMLSLKTTGMSNAISTDCSSSMTSAVGVQPAVSPEVVATRSSATATSLPES